MGETDNSFTHAHARIHTKNTAAGSGVFSQAQNSHIVQGSLRLPRLPVRLAHTRTRAYAHSENAPVGTMRSHAHALQECVAKAPRTLAREALPGPVICTHPACVFVISRKPVDPVAYLIKELTERKKGKGGGKPDDGSLTSSVLLGSSGQSAGQQGKGGKENDKSGKQKGGKQDKSEAAISSATASSSGTKANANRR